MSKPKVFVTIPLDERMVGRLSALCEVSHWSGDGRCPADVLERELSEAQRGRMRSAYRAAGPQAVAGFRQVLEAMMEPEMRRQYQTLKDAGA